jgi:hypothetical protein
MLPAFLFLVVQSYITHSVIKCLNFILTVHFVVTSALTFAIKTCIFNISLVVSRKFLCSYIIKYVKPNGALYV